MKCILFLTALSLGDCCGQFLLWTHSHQCTFHTYPTQLVEQAEFAEMIKEDAASLEERQETDSVPLVDDIRFHIASNVQTYSAIEEANQKLEALEELLSSINIDC